MLHSTCSQYKLFFERAIDENRALWDENRALREENIELKSKLKAQCYQVLTSIHGHIRQKLRPFLKLSRPPIKKFAAA